MNFDLKIQPVSTWDRDGSATFCRVREQWGEFSNMHGGYGYSDQGLFWRSTEHQFQAGAFSHLPDHQERIRNAANAMIAKKVAYERLAERRPDWQELNLAMMAYVLSRKVAVKDFGTILALTGYGPIIELSMRDEFWGAKPRGNKLVGRNMLGHLLMQLRAGARMDELPGDIRFPSAAAPTSAPRQDTLFSAPSGPWGARG